MCSSWGRESQADSMLNAEPCSGLDFTTRKSSPDLKLRVKGLPDWAPQVLLFLSFQEEALWISSCAMASLSLSLSHSLALPPPSSARLYVFISLASQEEGLEIFTHILTWTSQIVRTQGALSDREWENNLKHMITFYKQQLSLYCLLVFTNKNQQNKHMDG